MGKGNHPTAIAAEKCRFGVVKLLLEHRVGISTTVEIWTWRKIARKISTSEGHAVITQLHAASEEARALAQHGGAA